MGISDLSFLLLASQLRSGLAIPAGISSRSTSTTSFFYKPVSLTFSCESSSDSYNMNITADGQTYHTNQIEAITSISSPDFDVYVWCNFFTNASSQLKGETTTDGNITLATAQPVYSVACAPTPGGNSTCLPEDSLCEWNTNAVGSFELSCCSGICAGSLCRSLTGTKL